jgi:hypothetical protein
MVLRSCPGCCRKPHFHSIRLHRHIRVIQLSYKCVRCPARPTRGRPAKRALIPQTGLLPRGDLLLPGHCPGHGSRAFRAGATAATERLGRRDPPEPLQLSRWSSDRVE